MNVSEVMTRNTSACEPSESLERAAAIMWDRDCGAVPVVDGTGALHGIVTDRDVAMSAYLKGRPLAAIAVGEVMSRALHCCTPTDTVERALATMRQHQVHRMPVVDGEGRLTGILALSDVLRATKRAETKQRQSLTDALVETLSCVLQPRIEAPLPTQASAPATGAASVMASAPAKATAPPVASKSVTPAAPPRAAAAAPTVAPTATKPVAPLANKPSTTTTGAATSGTSGTGPGAKPTSPPQQPKKK